MECQDYFLRIDLNVKNYIESVSVFEILKTELPQPAGMIGMQEESAAESSDSSTQNIGAETPEEITTATVNKITCLMYKIITQKRQISIPEQ